MSPPTSGVVLISGVPGAGKTTVSRLVAAALPRSAVIHGDDIQNIVVSGRKHPNEEPAAEAEKQLELRDRNIASLADNIVDAGFVVVIDDVLVYRPRLDRLLSLIGARPVFLVVLAPAIDVVTLRDANRPEKTVFHIWSHLDAVMRRDMAGLGCWIDSSSQSAPETADELLRRVWGEGLIAPA